MRDVRKVLAVLLCLALTTGLFAGLTLSGFASVSDAAPFTGVCEDELPIIPITPHVHTWDEGTVTLEPTCTEPGEKTYHCTTCATGVKTEPIPALGHDLVEEVEPPTCTEPGSATYTCTRCGEVIPSEPIPPLGHDYAAVVTAPTCTEPGFTTWTCTRCGDSYVGDETDALGHTPGEPGKENETAPTCTTVGGYDTVTYCTVCGAELSREHTDLDALGHTPGEPEKENETAPTCTTVGGYDTVTCCTVCGAELLREHTDLDALGHVWDEGVLIESSGCTSNGAMLFTCTRCGETKTEAVSATGHTPGEATEENRVEPTCTLTGGYDTIVRCAVCGAILSTAHSELPALGHDYQAAVTAPTCTGKGFTTWTCARCGDSYVGDETEALGHDYQAAVTAPTCLEAGFTTYTCARCGESYVGDNTPALGHNFGEWTVTTAPTCTEPGVETRACTRCDAAETRALPAAGHQFVDGFCAICGLPDPEYVPPHPINPFTDVDENQYYFDAVAWAVIRGITNGMTDTTFAPNAFCTRAQVVTFLWRSEGSPAAAADGSPVQNPFTDVKESAYYYDAVLWAVARGITNGMTETTFAPNARCTRAQVVTFLWRSEGSPAAAADGSPVQNPFTDVKESAYYCDAVLWAVARGITNGMTETTFAPNAPCTRGQIVTFLYRDLA